MVCFATVAPPRCTVGQFECANGQCILESQVCDKLVDCVDGSDETDACGTYDICVCWGTSIPEWKMCSYMVAYFAPRNT